MNALYLILGIASYCHFRINIRQFVLRLAIHHYETQFNLYTPLLLIRQFYVHIRCLSIILHSIYILS